MSAAHIKTYVSPWWQTTGKACAVSSCSHIPIYLNGCLGYVQMYCWLIFYVRICVTLFSVGIYGVVHTVNCSAVFFWLGFQICITLKKLIVTNAAKSVSIKLKYMAGIPGYATNVSLRLSPHCHWQFPLFRSVQRRRPTESWDGTPKQGPDGSIGIHRGSLIVSYHGDA